jgi:hypothetical protein
MDELVSNLHHSIRRYCIENNSKWMAKYDEIRVDSKDRGGRDYSDEALSTFPRYLFYGATLEQIERYRPEEFASLDEAKAFFATLVEETRLDNPSLDGESEMEAVREERERFTRFIAEQSPHNLAGVEALFYRRVLSDNEFEGLRRKLDARWNLGKWYWYPLTPDRPDRVEAFQAPHFEEEVGWGTLRGMLSGTRTVWELRESGPSYEVEASAFEPTYNGAEGFWCDDTFDWVIYASHEDSVTIGGWLLEEVQAVWPHWSERVWTSPFFD